MADPLKRYRDKRDFSLTPEPAPSEGALPSKGAKAFVIQKHWASRLHYDLRLEIDGTMKSWAVPKGPSLDPSDKRMAIEVEDHPINYNNFEGQIPAGQYGGGRVIIWDRGVWEPVGDAAEGWRKGRLKFVLHGCKLKGRWALVRMGGAKANDKKPAWLLIKEHDGYERAASDYSVVDAQPDSVGSVQAPSAQGDVSEPPKHKAVRFRKPPAAAPHESTPRNPLPKTLAPQLATLVTSAPPERAQWLYELKFDGYRLLSRIEGQSVQLFTRNGNDWSHKMPHLVEALRALHLESGWLDGEVVAMDAFNRPDFQRLQNAFDGTHTEGLVYFLFDMPFCAGRDLRQLCVTERRELLRIVLAKDTAGALRLSETFNAPPKDLIASACKIGFEGVVGKRKASAYVSGRSADWIKLKCGLRQEFVIGGYTRPKGSRMSLGALLLGVYDAFGQLRYAGSVGSGFTDRSLTELLAQLVPLHSDVCPFAPDGDLPSKVQWVRPAFVAEVAFAQWTQAQHIRHSVFKGLRSDKAPQDIRREEGLDMQSADSQKSRARGGRTGKVADPSLPSLPSRPASGHRPGSTSSVSHGERVVDVSTGITKLDLVHYYAKVAPLMLEHLKARPVALVRAPTGVLGEQFFQKHQVADDVNGMAALDPALDPGHAPLLEVISPDGLRSNAQLNVIEYHTWNARKDRIERPDRMTLDLDPGEGVSWKEMQEAAALVRVLLQELGLSAFLKTSGGKGLHVVIPIKRLRGWDSVKGFSQAIVQHLAQTLPQRFVAKSGPRNRVGKIFVDYLRNGRGATTVCAWSARARPGMGVSVPLNWDELDTLGSAAHWHVLNIDQRLRVGNSPWQGYGAAAVGLSGAMKLLGYKPPT